MAIDFDARGIDREQQLLDLDRADQEESLYLFLKGAWKYMDPAPWQDSWAVDAICLPPETEIVTSLGVATITSIVDSDQECDVLSYNHYTSLVEWRRVTRRFCTPGKPLLKIGIGGKHIEITDNHPIYVKHKGYVRADQLDPGDKILYLRTLPQTIRQLNETVDPSDTVLQPSMLRSIEAQPEEAVLSEVRESQSMGWHNLHGLPRRATKEKFRTAVRELRKVGLSIARTVGANLAHLWGLLQQRMRRQNDPRGEQSILYSWAHAECLSEHVPAFAADGFGKGSASLLPVRRIDQASGSTSRRLEREAQYAVESSDALSKMSHSAARRCDNKEHYSLVEDTVQSVMRSSRICASVYNIEVDENNNYFANGILVHNCEHLQAVVDGQIKRLIINCPPRIGKSNTVSVAFPAWTWAQPNRSPTCGPGVPFLYASYADKLSLRDSVKCRRLIESPWYQARWGNRFQLTTDQNTKSRFTNDKGGDRLITSIGAGVTGEGGNIICVDDPNAANDVESEATTESTITWWTTAMPTRLNDPMNGAFIIIQQRLGEDDLTGHILEHEADGWTHLCLPGRYEPERSFHTSIGWKDPRTEPNELLWPERFSEEYLKRLERSMGPFTFEGQIQQRPEPKGGGIIKSDWWIKWEHEKWPAMDYVLAVLDTAYTADTMNDPSGMMVWGIFSDSVDIGVSHVIGSQDAKSRLIERDYSYSEFAPKVMLIWAWDRHLELHELVKKVAETCVNLKVDTLVIENKASGISVAQEIRRLYSREKFGVELFDPKSQDKMSRLYSVQHIFAEGIVHAPDKVWVDRVIKQVGQFPKGKHDEYVDLTSMGLRKLRDMGLLVRQSEREADLESQKIYPGGQDSPLYPA